MEHNFNQVKALVRLVRKHVVHQIFEFGAEWGAVMSLMLSPESAMLVCCDAVVLIVVAIYLVEWHEPGAHGEDDDAEGKQVRLDGLVGHAQRVRSRHVAGCSDFFLAEAATIFSLNRASKTKANDLQVEIRTEDQVLQL